MKSIVYVGMDVHKDSYSLYAIEPSTGEKLGETKIAAEIKLLKKFIQNISKKYDVPPKFITGYEAGCLGYSLYNEITALGIECHIMAPTTMYSSSKKKLVKNDKVDAKMIATNLVNGTYSSVYVPDAKDNEIKEYVRMRKNFKLAQKKIKQQINSFLLRLGYSFPGKSKWTKVHLKWLNELPLSGHLKIILEEYLLQFDELSEKVARYDQELETLSHSDRYENPVQKLRAIKGIDTLSGMTIHVEISDFSRFASAPAFAAYLGLTPNEHSSGASIRRGGITKQGNATVRSTLIECAQGVARGKIGLKTKGIKLKQKGQPAAVIRYADQAALRLQRKFNRLINSGKAYNVAIAAIARELACFVWGMETNQFEVQP